jgi:hypothetical protein
MSETMLSISGSNYIKVVLKQLYAFEGMGIARLMFTFELVNKEQNSNGYPLWLGGRVEIQAAGGNRQYVGRLESEQGRLVNVGRFGQETSAQLTLDMTGPQLWLMDESRANNGVRLFLGFSGHAQIDGQFVAIPGAPPLTHEISQSDWLELLRQTGLRRTVLLELDTPNALANPELTGALNYYQQALNRYGEGEWRLTVEAIRQSLAALVGKKAEDEDQASDITADISDAHGQARKGQFGFEPRRELVRKAAKLMADLAAHPESGVEIRKPDAYAALMIAGGLLHSFTTGVMP